MEQTPVLLDVRFLKSCMLTDTGEHFGVNGRTKMEENRAYQMEADGIVEVTEDTIVFRRLAEKLGYEIEATA